MNTTLPFIPPQLEQYANNCWYEGYFNDDEVARIRAIYEADTNKDEATVTGKGQVGYQEKNLRKSTVAFLPPNDPKGLELVNKLAQLAISVNFERYRFDLMGFYEPIQIAEYGEGDFFDWHSDFSAGHASTRKLSLSVQLSDPDEYEGGDLEFMVNTNQIQAPRTKGTVIIFPSFALHRVTPITSGTRMSMVGWVTGMPFR